MHPEKCEPSKCLVHLGSLQSPRVLKARPKTGFALMDPTRATQASPVRRTPFVELPLGATEALSRDKTGRHEDCPQNLTFGDRLKTHLHLGSCVLFLVCWVLSSVCFVCLVCLWFVVVGWLGLFCVQVWFCLQLPWHGSCLRGVLQEHFPLKIVAAVAFCRCFFWRWWGVGAMGTGGGEGEMGTGGGGAILKTSLAMLNWYTTGKNKSSG